MFKLTLTDGSELKITIEGFKNLLITQVRENGDCESIHIPFADIQKIIELINRFKSFLTPKA